MLHDGVDHGLGQPGHLRQEPVASGLDAGVEVIGVEGQVQDPRHALEVEEVVGVQRGQAPHGLLEVPAGVLVEVVLEHEAAVVLHAGVELVEVEADQAPVVAELHDEAFDLGGDPPDHLGALEDLHDVPDRDQVLDLQGGEVAGDLVEPAAVALEGPERLVGTVEQAGDGVQAVLLLAHVHRDGGHPLGDRDDRDVDGAGHPLGRAVAGARLRGGGVRVGDQVHVGPGDAAGVGRQDDGAVHLGQLRQALGTEGAVEQEPARADVEDLRTVPDDDEGAHATGQDAVEAFPQRGAGGGRGEGGTHRVTGRFHG